MTAWPGPRQPGPQVMHNVGRKGQNEGGDPNYSDDALRSDSGEDAALTVCLTTTTEKPREIGTIQYWNTTT